MSQATFSVPSISCGHCVRTIRAALGEVAGVQQVAVDTDTKQVAVVYDAAAVSEAQMRNILAAADYPVVETDATPSDALAVVESGARCGCCRI